MAANKTHIEDRKELAITGRVVFKGIEQEMTYFRLGNSLTWKYVINEDRTVRFFRTDSNGQAHWADPGEGKKREIVKVGDFVWFNAMGDHSEWGVMTPPKNPARRVFWEKGWYLPAQNFFFNLTKENLKKIKEQLLDREQESIEEIQAHMPGSCWWPDSFKEVVNESGNTIGLIRISRSWYQPGSNLFWHPRELWFARGCDIEKTAKNLLEIMNQ